MQISTFIGLRTDAPTTEFFALPLTAQVKGMGELAGVALLAETSLVVFAYQMADAGTLIGGCVVAIGTGWTERTVTGAVSGAYGPGELGRVAKGRIGVFEEGEESEFRRRLGRGTEDGVVERWEWPFLDCSLDLCL